jgi:hypothetical protein
MDLNSKDWYRFTVRQFNNLILDKDGFDIYEKYFLKGVNKINPYYEDFANTLLKLYGKMKERRGEIILSLMFAVICSQYPFLRHLKKFAM